MLEFVFVFGAAALSLSVMNGLAGRKTSELSDCIQQLLGFGFVDLGILLLILLPFQRLNIVRSAAGSALQIGGTAWACMIFVSLLTGVIAGFVSSAVSVHVKAERRGENNEQAEECKQNEGNEK